MVSLSLSAFDVPTSSNGCDTDYLELRDGAEKTARLVWRKCGSTFDPNEVFDLTSNMAHLTLVTSSSSNASFVAQYGAVTRDLQLTFTDPAETGPPVQLGNDLLVPWSTIEPIPKSGTAWAGLFKAGSCDEDNEWRHQCYIATDTLEPGAIDGVVTFKYTLNGNNGYMASGSYDVRFFAGVSQGHSCNIQNRMMTNNDANEYSRCQLSALATIRVYIAAPGTVPITHVPGTREYDSNWQTPSMVYM
jgi:hypothetical protein